MEGLRIEEKMSRMKVRVNEGGRKSVIYEVRERERREDIWLKDFCCSVVNSYLTSNHYFHFLSHFI